MVGILACSGYIPYHRLKRTEIGRAWGSGGSGEKAVAGFDEDSITMAVAAATDCLQGVDRSGVDGVYFASTTSPYKEKQAAATVAAALDLRKDVFTADVAGSLRGATIAMRLASDAVKSGSVRTVLVCAGEMRTGAPRSEMEMSLGDGAAALLIGKDRCIANIEGDYTENHEMYDVWRSDRDTFVRSWEDRFVREQGYTPILGGAVRAALAKYKLAPGDFARAVLYAPNQRELAALSKQLGFDAASQVQDTMYDAVGNTGVALAPTLLAAALQKAKPGERLLLAGYGDGADVLILRATDEVAKGGGPLVADYLNSKRLLQTYEKYLAWRELVATEPPARPPLEQPSPVALWRDSRGIALKGVRCRQCGTPQYPAQRVCVSCRSKDNFEDYSFAGRPGKVASFSHDNLAVSLDPPTTLTAVDFPEGGRIMCDITDRDPEQVKVGMPVEMTFRKVRSIGGVNVYWWKCRPRRQA